MKKITDAFCRLCQGMTAAIGAILLVMSASAMMIYGEMFSKGNAVGMTQAMLLMTVLISAGFVAAYRIFLKSGKRVAVILFAALVLFQIGFLMFVSHPMAISDPARVQNEALLMVQKQHGQMNMQDMYFQRYPNNHFIVVLFYYYYKMLSFLGIHKVWGPTVALNLVSIDIGVFISWLTARRFKGISFANVLLGLFILCPTTYVWLTTVYTNTISFPFVMAILYLCLRLHQRRENMRREYKLWAGLGTLMAVGYWVRPTTIIPIIAVSMYFVIRFIQGGTKDSVRVCLVKAGLAAGAFVCCFMGCFGLVGRHIDRSRLSGQFPITHWIMMGLNEQSGGEFSRSDEAYTMSYPTKEEKQKADVERIRERASGMGAPGLLRQAGVKMYGVWALSDDDCFGKAGYASNFPGLYPYFMGHSNTWYLLFMQAFRVATFFFLLVSVLMQIRQRKFDISFVFSLTFLGAVLFFILWEANRKYNVCFMGVYMLLMADGIERCFRYVRGVEHNRAGIRERLGVCMAIFGVLCFGLTMQLQIKTVQGQEKTGENVVYHCRNYPDSVPVNTVDKKKTGQFKRRVVMEQTILQGQRIEAGDKEKITINFEVKEKNLSKQGKNLKKGLTKAKALKNKIEKPSGRKEYRVEVISLQSRQKLYGRKVSQAQLDGKERLVIRLPRARRDSTKGYLVRLSHLGKKYTMVPKVSRFPDLNPYPYGSLYINGQKTSYDLSMSISKKHKDIQV